MLDPESIDYQVLLLAEDEILVPHEGDLWWRCGPRARLAPGEVHWLVGCNNLFYWGTDDAERIETLDDVAGIRQAHADLTAADIEALGEDQFNSVYAGVLWVCRKRQMRPQKPWTDRDIKPEHEHARALFMAWDPRPHQGWPD